MPPTGEQVGPRAGVTCAWGCGRAPPVPVSAGPAEVILDLKPAPPLDVRNVIGKSVEVIGKSVEPGYRKCPPKQPAGMFVRCRFGGALPVEAISDSLDLENGGAGAPHLRLEGTGSTSDPRPGSRSLKSLDVCTSAD